MCSFVTFSHNRRHIQENSGSEITMILWVRQVPSVQEKQSRMDNESCLHPSFAMVASRDSLWIPSYQAIRRPLLCFHQREEYFEARKHSKSL